MSHDQGGAPTTPTLLLHPFSSYCQKVLIAFYEADAPFAGRVLDAADPDAGAQLLQRWPIGKFPVLIDQARDAAIPEASIIIEYLALHDRRAAALLPDDPALRLEVRLLDRVFDNYVMTPQQKIVIDRLRDPAERDARGVTDAHAMLDTAYRWLDRRLARREWAAGDAFTLADCAAAPALFYADWVHPLAEHKTVAAYLRRLRARPSFARVVEEARPYRPLFPGGVPAHAD